MTRIARISLYTLISGVLIIALAGCTTGANPAGAPTDPLNFQAIQSVPIRTSVLEVVDRSAAKRAADDRSGIFVTSPVSALEGYFASRFRPNALEGTLRVIIDQAGVLVSRDGEGKTGVLATLSRPFNRADIVTLSVNLILEASNGGATELKLHQQEAIPSGLSLARREEFLQGVVEQMVNELDRAVLKAMDKTLRILAIPYDSVRPLGEDQVQALTQVAPKQAPNIVNVPDPEAISTAPKTWGQQYQ